jgi:hypothetical protein
MEDLKIVFYIVVAIAWVVYNNYRKITEASKKRDPSKPPPEVIKENWPPLQERKPKPHHTETVSKPVEKQKPVLKSPSRWPESKTVIPASKKAPRGVLDEHVTAIHEGGNIAPSKVVQFQEAGKENSDQNPFLEQLRNMDLRTGIVMAEILKRPYT